MNKISVPERLRKIVLLSDAYFFVRSVPVAEGTPASGIAGVCELAIESLSPFPLSQIYYGHHWIEGSPHALVYAAYRKRFTAEQLDEWVDAEAVLPTFATALATKMTRAGTLLLTNAEGITAIHWQNPAHGPSQVLYRAFPAEVDDVTKIEIHDKMYRDLGDTHEGIEITETPALDLEDSENDFSFKVGNLTSVYTQEHVDGLDIRDKEELQSRRRARIRDIYLWRAFAAGILLILCGVGLELMLVGGKFWQNHRVNFAQARAAEVEKIDSAFNLSNRIDELSNKRMLPFEMISIVDSVRPEPIVFDRVSIEGLTTLVITAHSANSDSMDGYAKALNVLPYCKAEVLNKGSRSGKVDWEIRVEFKHDFMTQVEKKT